MPCGPSYSRPVFRYTARPPGWRRGGPVPAYSKRTFRVQGQSGAAPPVHLALAPEVARVTGRYFVNRHLAPASLTVDDRRLAAELRRASSKRTGLETCLDSTNPHKRRAAVTQASWWERQSQLPNCYLSRIVRTSHRNVVGLPTSFRQLVRIANSVQPGHRPSGSLREFRRCGPSARHPSNGTRRQSGPKTEQTAFLSRRQAGPSRFRRQLPSFIVHHSHRPRGNLP